ncbi:MAG: lipopolysaccharide biosynthesis protein [Actinomycetes bacterium]
MQFASLTAANFMAMLVNFATAIILTHIMTKQDFGSYRYALTFLATVAVIAQLGIPYGASVYLTRLHDDAATRAVTTLTVLTMVGVSALASLLLVAGAVAAGAAGITVDRAMILAIPIVYATILQVAYIEMLKGANKIASIAMQTALPALGVLVLSMAAYVVTGRDVSFSALLLLYAISYSATHVGMLWRYRARSREDMRRHVTALRGYVRDVGRHVYLGSVFAVASSNALNLVLGRLVGMGQYGVFGLAQSMAIPMQTIPSVVGTVLFKDSATQPRLSRRSSALTFAVTGLAVACYVVALHVVFPVLFPPEYVKAAGLSSYLAVAYAMFGLGDYFNRFLGAHGRGREIKYGAIVVGLTNVGVAAALLPALGVMAVVISLTAASAVYLLLMVLFYRRLTSGPAHPEHLRASKSAS